MLIYRRHDGAEIDDVAEPRMLTSDVELNKLITPVVPEYRSKIVSKFDVIVQ